MYRKACALDLRPRTVQGLIGGIAIQADLLAKRVSEELGEPESHMLTEDSIPENESPTCAGGPTMFAAQGQEQWR